MTRSARLLVACLVPLVGCKSISALEREAFVTRVERIGAGIESAQRAAAGEPVAEIRAEREAVLGGIERDWRQARAVGEAALEADDPRGLEYARGRLDGVERRLSVLPRR